MLKAVLKKSRDGGKGNKKDSGRNVNKIFYNVDELRVINPQLNVLCGSSGAPWSGAQAAGRKLPEGLSPALVPGCCRDGQMRAACSPLFP